MSGLTRRRDVITRRDSLAGATAPQLDALVEAGAGDEAHVGREAHVVNGLLVTRHARHRLLLSFRSPQEEREVVRAGDQHFRRVTLATQRATRTYMYMYMDVSTIVKAIMKHFLIKTLYMCVYIVRN